MKNKISHLNGMFANEKKKVFNAINNEIAKTFLSSKLKIFKINFAYTKISLYSKDITHILMLYEIVIGKDITSKYD